MKDDEAFNVMFVLVIEKHEVLYNYKLEKYSNRNAKESAWQQVAIEVKYTVEECKKRWSMLRISLLRHLRENKKVNGSSGKKKKPFYLEDAMKYLIPYTKSRHQTGNAESDEDEVCDNHSQTVKPMAMKKKV
ncbi:uncharacterized protein LOC126743751 [Anthonomus grandis grandis]|uniref:uncharacterized protein LOC126743751 n=1 Tax=Anthonomus grandis grandis TaxID=2921223 RepID=UPI002165E25E|nr:uncharacterized protein LOC126743751 [Anthonomus grandis grandis]